MRSRIIALGVIAGFGTLLSVILVLAGLPEQTATQEVMLELSALPLSVALAAGDLILLERAVRHPGPRGRRVLLGGALLSAVGLALVALAYLTGPRGLVQFGQFLIFLGLGAVLLVAIRLQADTHRSAVSFADAGPLSPQSADRPDVAPSTQDGPL
ncbi:MAG TPA: hypothetical protein PKD84_02620 [Propionicimonas sp.]|nr:hypothetical protein [Propionicimonas sp.]